MNEYFTDISFTNHFSGPGRVLGPVYVYVCVFMSG